MSKRQRDSRDYARRMRMIQEQAAARRGRMRKASAAIAVVLVAFAVMVLVKVGGFGTGGEAAAPAPTGSAAAQVVADVTGVPAAVLDRIGAGTTTAAGLPKPLTGPPPVRTEGGKPLVLYVGAEYCPFCAAQRWPMVVALSRFGTFEGLAVSRSASDDVFPNTPTVSFHGSTYTSELLFFQGVETSSNVRKGNAYTPLDKLTAEQAEILRKFNAPPYVPADSAGSIPFVDFADQAIAPGASFSPELLKGLTAAEVAAQLDDPDSEVGKAVGGNANAMTALLCKLTGGKPGDVCSSAAVAAFQGKF